MDAATATRMFTIFKRTRATELNRMRQWDARWNICSPKEYRQTHMPRFDLRDHLLSLRVHTWTTLQEELSEAQWIFDNCILDPELEAQLRTTYPTDAPRTHISDEQRCTLVQIIAGYNLFVTGPAGTGKSKMVLSARLTLQEMFRVNERSMVVCGTTGVAASAVGGATAHSKFALLNPTQHMWISVVKKTMDAAETLVLDEVSMLSVKDLYRIHLRITAAARRVDPSAELLPFGGVQVVLVGDFFQLPPVEPTFTGPDAMRREENQLKIERADFIDVLAEYAEFARWRRVFATPLWLQTVGLAAYMVTVKRQRDLPFAQLLHQLRWGTFNEASWAHFLRARTIADERTLPERAMCLYAKNAEASARNAAKICDLPKEDLVFVKTQMTRMVDNGRELVAGSLTKERSQVTLRIGALGRLTRNICVEDDIINSSLFRLVGLMPIDEIAVQTPAPPHADSGAPPPAPALACTMAHRLDPEQAALFQPAVDAARRACGMQSPVLLDAGGFRMTYSGNGGIVLTMFSGRESSVYGAEKTHPFAVPRDVSSVHRYTRDDGATRGKHSDFDEPEINLTRHYCPVVHFVKQPAGVHHVLPPFMTTLCEFSHGRNVPLITEVQMPFIAAYASTVHSAEGLSLDCVAVKITSSLDPALVYTALTRATSAEGLYIIGKLPLDRCRPPVEVRALYNAYDAARARAQQAGAW